jgi:hypothetical protein
MIQTLPQRNFITLRDYEFPTKLLERIYSYKQTPLNYIAKLGDSFFELIGNKKSFSVSSLKPPASLEEIIERVLSSKRIHLDSDNLTFENSLNYLVNNGLEIVDEITYSALFDLCSPSLTPIPDFGCIALPCVFEDEGVLKARYVYPSKEGSGGQYSYKKGEFILKDDLIKPKFLEFFVIKKAS